MILNQASRCARILMLVLFGGIAVGCTTLDVDIPTPEIQAPEVAGASWSGAVGIGAQSAANVEVTSDASRRTPDLASPEVKGSAAIPLIGELGIGSRFQIGLRAGVNSGATGVATYQLVGKPAKEAGPGNHSLALYGSYGMVTGSASGDQATLFGAGGFPWTAKARVRIGGAGASYGYRFTDSFMAYIGHAQDWYRATGEVVQSPSTDGTSAGGSYSFSQSGEARASALGLMIGKITTFSVQAVYRHFEWTSRKSIYGPEYAANFRIGF